MGVSALDICTNSVLICFPSFILFTGGGGTSWSGTVTKLLQPGVLFHHETPTIDWFYSEMEKWKHYIPVAWHLEDLQEKFEFAQLHPHLAKSVAKQGMALGKKLLSAPYMKQVYQELFVDYLSQAVSVYRSDSINVTTWDHVMQHYHDHDIELYELSRCNEEGKCKTKIARNKFSNYLPLDHEQQHHQDDEAKSAVARREQEKEELMNSNETVASMSAAGEHTQIVMVERENDGSDAGNVTFISDDGTGNLTITEEAVDNITLYEEYESGVGIARKTEEEELSADEVTVTEVVNNVDTNSTVEDKNREKHNVTIVGGDETVTPKIANSTTDEEVVIGVEALNTTTTIEENNDAEVFRKAQELTVAIDTEDANSTETTILLSETGQVNALVDVNGNDDEPSATTNQTAIVIVDEETATGDNATVIELSLEDGETASSMTDVNATGEETAQMARKEEEVSAGVEDDSAYAAAPEKRRLWVDKYLRELGEEQDKKEVKMALMYAEQNAAP